MNIDAQIRDILSRSYPVNDNDKTPLNNGKTQDSPTDIGIYVVGNNNIIISSGLMITTIMAFFLSMYLFLQH